MKLWVDDIRQAPEGYKWCRSVNDAIQLIETSEKRVQSLIDMGHSCFRNRDYTGRNACYRHVDRWEIKVIDLDHDAGDYASDGGDYIKLLDWLEETGRSYPIRIHSMNPVGVENMRRVIERNHWVEIQ